MLPTQLAEDLIAITLMSMSCVDGHMNIVIINRFLKPRCIVVFAFLGSRSIRGLITKVRLEGSSISLVYFKFVINIPKMLKYDQILVYSNPPILPLIPDVLHRLLKKKYSFVVYDIAPDNAIKTGATRPGSMIDKLMRYINRHVDKNAKMSLSLVRK